MTSPELSVVIPTHQRRAVLQRTLAGLAGQTVAGERFEVVVSIDGSTDGTPEMLAATAPTLPYALTVERADSAGPGAARNRGARPARGAVLLFLDDDILPTPSLVAEHLAGHAEADHAVVLGQVRVVPAARLSPWESYLVARYEQHYDKLDQPGYVLDFWDCLSGNVSIARALFDASDGFDAGFGACKHDDIEWGYRLAGLGAQFVYRQAALGYHQFSKSPAAGLRDAFTDGWSAVRLAHRYPALRPRLLHARWARQPAWRRAVARQLLAAPWRLHTAAAVAATLLRVTEPLPLPAALRRGVHRAAYHTQFWLGVRRECEPEEWGELAGTL